MSGSIPLVFNPHCGGGRGGRRARRAQELLWAHKIRTRLEPTAGPGGARPLAEALATGGETRIFVLGGDGTLGEAADGIARSGRDVTLGFLPGGTGNSFLRDFGVTHLEDAVARIGRDHERRVDAADVQYPGGTCRFINVFGVGFLARVCELANRLKLLRTVAYPAAVFPEVARLRSPRTRIVIDGEVVEDEFALVGVHNTRFTGGGMLIAPPAIPDDGMLDVVALRRVSRSHLVKLFGRIYDGDHLRDPAVWHATGREIRIEPDEPGPLLIDGEVGGTTPVTVRVAPNALRLLL